jgi:hypothetical protein
VFERETSVLSVLHLDNLKDINRLSFSETQCRSAVSSGTLDNEMEREIVIQRTVAF